MTEMFFRSTAVVIVLCQCCTMLIYLLILILLMQSEKIKKLPEGQRTFAMLAEAFNIDVYEARLCMFPNFMSRKREWVEQISSHLLGLKK